MFSFAKILDRKMERETLKYAVKGKTADKITNLPKTHKIKKI